MTAWLAIWEHYLNRYHSFAHSGLSLSMSARRRFLFLILLIELHEKKKLYKIASDSIMYTRSHDSRFVILVLQSEACGQLPDLFHHCLVWHRKFEYQSIVIMTMWIAAYGIYLHISYQSKYMYVCGGIAWWYAGPLLAMIRGPYPSGIIFVR